MSIITISLVAITVIVSLVAFNNTAIFNQFIFYPYRVWRNNEWYRLITHGFIHADLNHLFFNMFALFSFGEYVEAAFSQPTLFGSYGPLFYLSLYLAAIVFSDVFNLFTKRNNPAYRSLGASGGVSAVVFSSILLNPFGQIGILFIPIGIPAFVFGFLYLLYCAYMARRGGDNVGHMAHFTGSVFGFFVPVIFHPWLLTRFIDKILHP